eukprot:CAMPEP_0182574070 /NCGR_PEP_ID=MMETSP1324-20130603/22108_1 /TAXON_ID=236786 /ORGANISM="Florenciella sp., Strain RCC1587" /LENGTH=63 /DNA_ID=CAMNT_0024789319 /DNA_START=139 /DNA_END=327 /DNA_ORIENTATION=-
MTGCGRELTGGGSASGRDEGGSDGYGRWTRVGRSVWLAARRQVMHDVIYLRDGAYTTSRKNFA